MLEFDVGYSVVALMILWASTWAVTPFADGQIGRSGLGPPRLKELHHTAVAFRHGRNLGQINDKKIEDTEEHTRSALFAEGATGRAGSSCQE